MNSTLVKICGITRVEDGLAALSAGADWLGFIRWSNSKRYRPLENCAALLRDLRGFARRPFQAVAVYVDAPRETIDHELDVAGFDRVQLHGSESPEFVASLTIPAIKTIKIKNSASLADADHYPEVDLLTDTDVPGLPGGTGRGYDVSVLAGLIARRRVIVAGGLNPENVGELVQRLHPYGVDVSSGVESEPGIKDEKKIRSFIAAIRAAESQFPSGNLP